MKLQHPLIHRLIAAPLKATSRGFRNAAFAIALLMASAQLSSAAVTVTATNDDGVPAATKKNPGDTVTYTIQINSTGGTDATGVTLTDPTAANTSEVAGSLNVTPVALDDTYPQTVQANQTVNTATSGFTVVTNDYPGILAGNPVALSALTITFDAARLNGGIVTMTASGANVGRFTYSAPPGFTGTDTFTYTISNGVAGTPAGSATGKVTITVAGPVIWFVDDSAPAGGNGTWTGTNSKAFQTVAQAAAVDAANHRIYLASGTYTNGIVLNTGEWVVGEGAVGTTFDALMGITPGTDTPARPGINGTKPAWSAAGGSSVVTLADNDTILGVAITGNSVAAMTGTSVNTGLIGNATTTDTTITSGTGGSFTLSGGSGAIGMNATISNTGGRSVSISGRGAGIVTFSRAITDTGTGIFLDNNDQSGVGTITFTGGLNLSTGVNAAFTATNGGIVNATQDNTTIVNTLTTTTGTALNVANTTIGASGLTFRSIAANGGSNGIVLNTTGASGGLTVTGNGGTCTDADKSGCSGGVIQNTVGGDDSGATPIGTGIVLNSTQSVSLTRMHIHDHTNYGVNGTSLTGFTFNNCVISGSNGTNVNSPFRDSSMSFDNLLGTVSFANDFISGGTTRNVEVTNTSGTLTITINACTIHDTGKSPFTGGLEGDDNLYLGNQSTANITAHITNNTFSQASGDHFNGDLSGSGAISYVITGNNYSNTLTGGRTTLLGGGFFILAASYTGQFTYKISDNGSAGTPLTGNNSGGAIVVNKGSGGIAGTTSFSGRIENNLIGNPAVTGSGSLNAGGIQVEAHGVGSSHDAHQQQQGSTVS